MSVSKIVYKSENNIFQLQVELAGIISDNWEVKFSWTPQEFNRFCETIEFAQDAQFQNQDLIDSDPNRCLVCGKFQASGWGMGGFVNDHVICQPCGAGRRVEVKQLYMDAENKRILENW